MLELTKQCSCTDLPNMDFKVTLLVQCMGFCSVFVQFSWNFKSRHFTKLDMFIEWDPTELRGMPRSDVYRKKNLFMKGSSCLFCFLFRGSMQCDSGSLTGMWWTEVLGMQ